MKRCIPLLLALVLCLTGCGQTEILPLETEEEAALAVTEQSEPTAAAVLDWDKAFAAYAPDTVVFTVGESEATWQELFYQIAYCTASLEYSTGAVVSDWNMEMTDSDGNIIACGDYILQMAVSMLQQYHIVYNELTALGVELEEQDIAELEAYKEQIITQGYAGDTEAFLADLGNLFCTEEIWDWFNEVDALHSAGYRYLYGAMGEKLDEAEVMEYAEEYSYVNTWQIYLYNREEESPADAQEPVADTMTDLHGTGWLLSELEAVKDDPTALEQRFGELFDEYNENAALEYYADGWCIWQGDTEEAVYQAALAMEDYGYTVVEMEDADVLVMRLPMRADATVYCDASTGSCYTLAYYAAWEVYSELINGEEGWLNSAVTTPAAEFESFRLTDVF